MYKKLTALGLSEKQARIYVAALKLGKGSVDEIANKAEFGRTAVYPHLEEMLALGLISTLTEGKKTLYIAEDPGNLKNLITQKRKEADTAESVLTDLLPDLTATHNRHESKPIVRYFSGKPGIISMRNEVLKMQDKELCIVTAYDKFLKLFPDPKERAYFSEQRAKKKIKTRVLYSVKKSMDVVTRPLSEIRQIDEKQFPFDFDIYLFDKKIALSSSDGDVWGIIIESKPVHDSMKSLFEIAWISAKK